MKIEEIKKIKEDGCGIVKLTKKHFIEKFEKGKAGAYPYLPRHVENVEKWAKYLLLKYPKADKEIVLVSVWLHDIGQTFGSKNKDHAVKSEEEAKNFLVKEGYLQEKIDKVAHCVRAHRCSDIIPATLEAKMLAAAADSASHFTDINYIVHLTDKDPRFGRSYTEGKIERDYRDIGAFSDLKKELSPVYRAWKELVKVFPSNME